ncbi:hypothetical protein NIES2101_42700 [Calothrix sp. HK-06]|nr:hypothetical protein NIES2101_42700 [Calothrix sp. HK-06]
MATDYIKRIQSNLSRKNIKLSKPTIRKEVEQLGYNNETLTDDSAVSILNKLVAKFSNEVEPMPLIQQSKTSPKPELKNDVQQIGHCKKSELKNDVQHIIHCQESELTTHVQQIVHSQESELTTHVQQIVHSQESELTTHVQQIVHSQESELSHQDESTNLDTSTLTEMSTDLNLIERGEAENQLIESEEEAETRIVVSEGEKHDLITSQSSVLDVRLSELETIELCSQIPDVFDDYKSFVASVTSAIKTFVDDKFDHQETSTVDDSIFELRQHIAARQARLDTKFAQGLNDVKEDLEQIRSNIKSRQVAIVERFRIPAKT